MSKCQIKWVGCFLLGCTVMALTMGCSTTQKQRSYPISNASDLPEIVQVDFKTLRSPTQPVPIDQIRSPEIQGLIERMIQVMRKAPGVGIAAPQIGDSRQIIVLEDRQEYIDFRLSPEEARHRGRVPFPLKVIINPKLTLISPTHKHERPKYLEGCLSVEGHMAEVERAWEVQVEGWDEHAKPLVWQVSGWPARILQHEVDHLNETLYIDRMDRHTFRVVPGKGTLVKEANLSTDPSVQAEILLIGDTRLRTKASVVKREDVGSPENQKLISTLIDVMRKRNLVGIAAPQIGASQRVIVVEDRQERVDQLSSDERLARERVAFPLKVIINPKLTFIDSGEPVTGRFPEGSPCVMDFQGVVERRLEVQVEGWDMKGAPLIWKVRGWPARILQHEVDHLDGILYTDRMDTRTFKYVPPNAF